MKSVALDRQYPRKLKTGKGSVQITRLGPETKDAFLDFARGLEPDDLMFLRVDITQAGVVQNLIEEQAENQKVTLLACDDSGAVLAYASVNRQGLPWMRHLGEVRVVVAAGGRGQGLGTRMAREVFQVAESLGLVKVIARMAREQVAAQEMFRSLGFNAEALLTDWVIDRQGNTHDLVVMSHDVTALTN